MPKPTPFTSLESRDDFGLPFSNLKFSANIAGGASASLLIPGDAPRYKAIIVATNPIFVALNEIAEEPAGATFERTTSEMQPRSCVMTREVKKGDTLDFYSNAILILVTVALYAIN